jgi:hypothetical protein
MTGIRKIWIFFLLLLPQLAFSQSEKVASAIELLQKGALEEARAEIDAAVVHPQTSIDFEAWYLRGFIYKELYKTKEKSNPESALREEAINSFKKSIEFDKEKDQEEDNLKNLRFLANTFYNDVAENLNQEKYSISEKVFERYKKLMLDLGQGQELAARETEFRMALGHLFTTIYEKDRGKNEAYFEKIKNVYESILLQNPNHIGANYNLGILYYNNAVHIINDMDYDIDIFELMELQEKTVKIFKKSLPYMEKAYQLDPKKKETLKGLEGIYFSLNDFEKSNEFKMKIQNLD